MSWLKVAAFTLVLVGLFVWAGAALTDASGNIRHISPGEDVSVANGDAIFWGAGKCHTCHAVGPRGTSVRGPNLGDSPVGPPIGARAAERAAERTATLGRAVSATDYLVESLSDPSAYVVSGFKDEMPVIYEPPIALTPNQLRSVVLYLQSLGGSPAVDEIELPPAALQPSRGPSLPPGAALLEGDPDRGRELFFDAAGPAACGGCHRVADEGADIGPELTNVAGTRSAGFIAESILEPAATIAGGYETWVIETADGRILDGLILRSTADSLWIARSATDEIALAQDEVARRRELETSLMPDNFAETLSVRDLSDLLAFLRTLR